MIAAYQELTKMLIAGEIVNMSQGESAKQMTDLLEGKSAEERKTYPVKTGFLDYFRDAVFRVAHVSYVGSKQHHPNEPVHWARTKSTDQLDCVARHLMESDLNILDDRTETALASTAWRALAQLQLFLERRYNLKPPPNVKD
jgi:hypothetical protein